MTHLCGQLTYNKGGNDIQRSIKSVSSVSGVGRIGQIHAKNKIGSFLHHIKKTLKRPKYKT